MPPSANFRNWPDKKGRGPGRIYGRAGGGVVFLLFIFLSEGFSVLFFSFGGTEERKLLAVGSRFLGDVGQRGAELEAGGRGTAAGLRVAQDRCTGAHRNTNVQHGGTQV